MYNEIQLTKKKDSKKRKIKNHPLSHVKYDKLRYPEWPHRQGGCLTCCGCTFESS